MKYTAAHWGSYEFESGSLELNPIRDDPSPSRIGKGWVSAARNKNCRVMAPVIRKGWLEGDGGRDRCNDSFIEVSWDQALDAAAGELIRVRESFGNQAIFGGSYGWSSAGRFHHAQSQMRRCLAVSGGFTSSRDTYSHAAAEVLWPHVLGMSNGEFQDQMTSHSLVEDHCELLLSFGGISARTAQISSAGTTFHEVGPWTERLKERGVRTITVSPERGEAKGEWISIRPGTDTAMLLGLIYEVVALGREDTDFLQRCTSGWSKFRSYVIGSTDGQAKSAEWAAKVCDISADTIRNLAIELSKSRSMISMAWGMQRADHGEQPIWAGLALASVLGQIGQPGTGYAFGYGSISTVGRPNVLIPWPSLPKIKNKVADYIPVARITDMLTSPGKDYSYNGNVRQYPDIKLVWWTGGNPFHHHQDLRRLERAWTHPETVIVNEHSWTATARRADIVLPATTPLERNDLLINRKDPTLLYMSKMFDPLGQARDDFDIFAGIADRLGKYAEFTEERSSEDWIENIWSQCQEVGTEHGIELPDWDAFRTTGRFDVPDSGETRVALSDFVKDPAANLLGTESGKITLYNERIAQMQLPDCPGYPSWMPPAEGAPLGAGEFHLISGQPDTRLHGQNDQGDVSLASKVQGREVCRLHPEAAASLNLANEDVVLLSNSRGACLAVAEVDANIRQDCVFLPTGAWFDPQTVDGQWIEVHGNPNALTIDKGCSSLSQGNIAHTAVVSVSKWDGPLPELSISKPPEISPLSK